MKSLLVAYVVVLFSSISISTINAVTENKSKKIHCNRIKSKTPYSLTSHENKFAQLENISDKVGGNMFMRSEYILDRFFESDMMKMFVQDDEDKDGDVVVVSAADNKSLSSSDVTANDESVDMEMEGPSFQFQSITPPLVSFEHNTTITTNPNPPFLRVPLRIDSMDETDKKNFAPLDSKKKYKSGKKRKDYDPRCRL